MSLLYKGSEHFLLRKNSKNLRSRMEMQGYSGSLDSFLDTLGLTHMTE